MSIEEYDVNNRMMWYMKTYSDVGSECITTFDPIIYLSHIEDFLNKSYNKMYICERNLKCTCKKKCMCDSDIYHPILSYSMMIGSNCNYICSFMLPFDIKLSSKKILRCFTLDDKTDIETPIIDIIRPNKIIFLLNGSISFSIDDTISIKNSELIFKFDYMSFSN